MIQDGNIDGVALIEVLPGRPCLGGCTLGQGLHHTGNHTDCSISIPDLAR